MYRTTCFYTTKKQFTHFRERGHFCFILNIQCFNDDIQNGHFVFLRENIDCQFKKMSRSLIGIKIRLSDKIKSHTVILPNNTVLSEEITSGNLILTDSVSTTFKTLFLFVSVRKQCHIVLYVHFYTFILPLITFDFSILL